MKKTFSIITVLFVIHLIFSFSVFAEKTQQPKIEITASTIVNTSVARFPEEKVSLLSDSGEYRLYEIIKQGLFNGSESILLYDYYDEGYDSLLYSSEEDLSTIRKAVAAVLHKNPELFLHWHLLSLLL